jgi:hypothetical protein
VVLPVGFPQNESSSGRDCSLSVIIDRAAGDSQFVGHIFDASAVLAHDGDEVLAFSGVKFLPGEEFDS